jgi:hypothetical protein
MRAIGCIEVAYALDRNTHAENLSACQLLIFSKTQPSSTMLTMLNKVQQLFQARLLFPSLFLLAIHMAFKLRMGRLLPHMHRPKYWLSIGVPTATETSYTIRY